MFVSDNHLSRTFVSNREMWIGDSPIEHRVHEPDTAEAPAIGAPMHLIEPDHYNIGHICTRLQCEQGRGDKIAFRWITARQERTDVTFNDLDHASSRFSSTLQSLGFSRGDILFTFLPKMPEQFFCFLGALKHQVICGTLFSNFGEEALVDRLQDSGAKGLVTKKSLLKKVQCVRHLLPSLKYILVVDMDAHLSEDVLSYPALMQEASETYRAAPTNPETPSVLH